MQHTPLERKRGMTAIEISIALVIMAVVSVPLTQTFNRMTSGFGESASRSHFTARASAVMERITAELLTGRFVTLDPPIPAQSTYIRFERPVDFVDGECVYSNPIQIEYVEPEGEDTTGSLRIWEDVPPIGLSIGPEDVTNVVATNVATNGLTFTRSGAMLNVQLTLVNESTDGGTPDLYTLVSGVKMRNVD